MPYKEIVVALNGVEEETEVLKQAFALADSFSTKLKILHVNDPDAGEIHMMMDHFPKVSRKDLVELIKKAGLENRLKDAEFLIITEKDPVAGIIKVSATADLLILGHHKKNAILALITDSTDERIADKAECPVLLIPIRS